MGNNVILYRHLKPCGEVFYIGIGKTEKRAYSKHSRSKFWRDLVNKYDYEVQILKSDLSWEEACELEILLISYYGRRDLGTGSLVNLTNGGEGSLGVIVSEETRQKLSEASKGFKHSEETKEICKMINLGRKRSDETKKKLSEYMLEYNKIHGSRLIGFKFSQESKDKMSESAKNNSSRCKKVIDNNTQIIYKSVKKYALINNINVGKLYKILNNIQTNDLNIAYVE